MGIGPVDTKTKQASDKVVFAPAKPSAEKKLEFTKSSVWGAPTVQGSQALKGDSVDLGVKVSSLSLTALPANEPATMPTQSTPMQRDALLKNFGKPADKAPAATAAWVVDAPTEFVNQPPFDAGIEKGLAERRLAVRIGMTPGQLLADSNIPLLKNLGKTLASAGQAIAAPFVVVEGVVKFDSEITKEGLDDFVHGILGVLGVDHLLLDEYVKTGGGQLTGSISAPRKYAAAIINARKEMRPFNKEDEQNGMKGWHSLSNVKLASTAGLTELPWLFLGGVVHEIDPFSAAQEIEAQTVPYWLLDSAGDVLANTMGLIGGLLLPEHLHLEYAKKISTLLPGPTDPWEGAAITSRNPGGTGTSNEK